MPSLQSVRRKIDSVKKTQKITKAMKMVAAAKLKRTQDRILAARPVRSQDAGYDSNAEPARQSRRRSVAQETRGASACRGRGHERPWISRRLHANILRTAAAALKEFESKGMQVEVAVIGKKGRDFFRRRHWKVRREWWTFSTSSCSSTACSWD